MDGEDGAVGVGELGGPGGGDDFGPETELGGRLGVGCGGGGGGVRSVRRGDGVGDNGIEWRGEGHGGGGGGCGEEGREVKGGVKRGQRRVLKA